MIRRAYGFTAYGGILFVIALWFSLTIHDGSKGNPCGNMISYMKGEIKLFSMLSRMIFQLLGGLASYRYAKNFWYLGLTQVSIKVPYLLSDLKNQTIVSSCVTHILPSCGYFKGQEQICFNPTSWHLVTYNFLRGHKF